MGDGDLQDLDVRRNRYKLLILYFRMVLKEWYNFYKAYNTGEKLSPPGFVFCCNILFALKYGLL